MTADPAPLPLPELAQLRPRQQMAIDCARCARHLGMSGRVLGDVRYRGLMFRLWICGDGCRSLARGER